MRQFHFIKKKKALISQAILPSFRFYNHESMTRQRNAGRKHRYSYRKVPDLELHWRGPSDALPHPTPPEKKKKKRTIRCTPTVEAAPFCLRTVAVEVLHLPIDHTAQLSATSIGGDRIRFHNRALREWVGPTSDGGWRRFCWPTHSVPFTTWIPSRSFHLIYEIHHTRECFMYPGFNRSNGSDSVILVGDDHDDGGEDTLVNNKSYWAVR